MSSSPYPIKVNARINVITSPEYEINVNKQAERSKLPLSDFPITANKNEDGQVLTLHHGNLNCDASIHRSSKAIWINSADARLSNHRQIELYDDFIKSLPAVRLCTEKSVAIRVEFISQTSANIF